MKLLLTARNMGISVDVYIDDFYGAAPSTDSFSAFNRMTSLFRELGLAASDDKDVPPCTRMVCLGIEIDTNTMTLSVPSFRVQELRHELKNWLSMDTYTKHDLQRLLGKLSFVSAYVRPGRIFMCRLLNALRNISSRLDRLIIDSDMKADISWWISLLDLYNGVSVIPVNVTIANPEVFATDACLDGCGALCFNEYFKRHFPAHLRSRHINELELITIVIAIKLWAPRLQGRSVELASDNTTCISVINNKRSAHPFLQHCLRELWLSLSLHNIALYVRYVASRDNFVADMLSRYFVDHSCRARFDDYSSRHDLSEVVIADSLFDFTLLHP